MSVDQQDLSAQWTASQTGMGNQFAPIIFIPNGLRLNQEVELNIKPCDSIWVPTIYDKSYGVNPAQSYRSPVTPVNWDFTSASLWPPAILGQNLVDIFDDAPPSATQINLAAMTQQAGIYGVRFNTPNNPWLLWGLCGLRTWNQVMVTNGAGATQSTSTPVGLAGAMRAINGPIARMWIKIYSYASLGYQTVNTLDPGDGSFSYSQLVMMSCTGFNTTTVEQQGSPSGQNGGPLMGAPQTGGTSTISTGGYQTPQMNTAEREGLK